MPGIGTRLSLQLLIPIFFGVVAFGAITNWQILDPRNIAWLYEGDPQAFYLGWLTFKNSSWSMPPGLNAGYGLELARSVFYVDIVPLMALALKSLVPQSPEPFQYVGFWILLCFLLQSVFAWKLARAVGLSRAACALVSLLFLFLPAWLWRLNGHFALFAHWVILASLYLYLIASGFSFSWVLLLSATALIQPYLLVLVIAIWVADLARRQLMQVLRPNQLVGELLLGIGAVATALWIAGAFAIHSGFPEGGYGILRMNLLSLVNPWGWSYVIPIFPQKSIQEIEGFQYLGLGVLFLAALSVPAILDGHARGLPSKRFVPLLVCFAGLTAFAISNRIAFGMVELLHVPVPDWILNAASVFRTSGRLFWPVYYSIVLGVLWLVWNKYGRATALLLLLGAVVIQIADTRAGWRSLQARYDKAGTTWPSPLASPFWEAAAAHYKKIRGIPAANGSRWWPVVTPYAAQRGLGTDIVYFSRVDTRKLESLRREGLRVLHGGLFANDTLYVLDEESARLAVPHLGKEDLLAKIDGLNVLAPGGASLGEKAGLTTRFRPPN